MSKKSVSTVVEDVLKAVSAPQEVSAESSSPKEATETTKPRARAKERQILDDLGDKIKKLHDGIVVMQKKSTGDAAKIGAYLRRVKTIFTTVNVGTNFSVWCKSRCGLSEGSVHNYIKLAEGIAKDPTLAEMGLTNAYYALGLKKKQVNEESTGSSSGSGETSDNGGDQTKVKKTTVKIGNVEVFQDRGFYVIELDSNWKAEFQKIAANPEALEKFIATGLVFRALPPNPEFDDLGALISEG